MAMICSSAVELVAQVAHSVDPADAVRRLKPALAQIPNVVSRQVQSGRVPAAP